MLAGSSMARRSPISVSVSWGRFFKYYIPFATFYIVGLCPDGSSPVDCLVNPCDTASCPAVADATCVADYCGGCNARWILNGKEVTDRCHGKVAIIYIHQALLLQRFNLHLSLI